MKRFLIIATLSLFGIVASFAVSPSSTAIIQFPDSTGTNMVFQVNANGTVLADGAVTPAGKTVVLADNAAYTAAVAKATSALQPNAVAKTNVIVSVDNKTNTLIVIGGQITSWVVTE